MPAKNTALVTGGAGFLGSHLVRRLLGSGWKVTVLDNFRTGRRENLTSILDDPALTLREGDVRELTRDLAVERIYNLASPASPPHYQKDPVDTFTTNVLGTLKVLELARATGARVLQASTSEIYGDPLVSPQSEAYWGNVNPIGPRSCYDEGKRAAETACMDYVREYGVDVRVIRIFNTYGPLMDPLDGRVVSNFIMQALRNEPLTIYGDGTQTRSFQYVDDLIEGMLRVMDLEEKFPGPVNLGNPREFTVRELAEMVLAIIPESRSTIETRPLPADDPKRRKPEIALAREKLGWEPKISLEEGLKKTVEYFKTHA